MSPTEPTRYHHLAKQKTKTGQTIYLYTHTRNHTQTGMGGDKESEIFNALANALTGPANRPLKEMSSQLPEVCPLD